MGYRTIVSLVNDEADKWIENPDLGGIIAQASVTNRVKSPHWLDVVECAHADTASLILACNYSPVVLSTTYWYHGRTNQDMLFELLSREAEKLGYSLVKTRNT